VRERPHIQVVGDDYAEAAIPEPVREKMQKLVA